MLQAHLVAAGVQALRAIVFFQPQRRRLVEILDARQRLLARVVVEHPDWSGPATFRGLPKGYSSQGLPFFALNVSFPKYSHQELSTDIPAMRIRQWNLDRILVY